jgi:DNA-binding CsgD family transcriptional regulator
VIRLTQKESQILGLRYEGLKNADISKKLHISQPDVSQTLSRIAKKVISIKDTLELMKTVGVLKHDVEIELTESGQAFLTRWQERRQPRTARHEKAPTEIRHPDSSVTVETVVYERREPISYDEVAKALERAMEALRSLGVETDKYPLRIRSEKKTEAREQKYSLPMYT